MRKTTDSCSDNQYRIRIWRLIHIHNSKFLYEGSQECSARVEETGWSHGDSILCVRIRKVNFTSIYPYIETANNITFTVTSIMTGKKRKSEDGKEATKKPKPKSREEEQERHQVGRGGLGQWRQDGRGKQMESEVVILECWRWALLVNQRPKSRTIIQSETLISGLTACCNKGGAEFLKHESPDVLRLCFQVRNFEKWWE